MDGEIKFEYKQSKDFVSSYVNGCYGGKTPKGEILINFFKEEPPLPSSETYEIGSKGQLSKVVSVESDNESMIRNIECSVIMSEESAREIYEWLGHVLNG